jgi:hypothetical protein
VATAAATSSDDFLTCKLVLLLLLLPCRYLYLGMEQAADVVNAALQQLLTKSQPAVASTTPAADAAAATAAVASSASGSSSSSSSSSNSGVWTWFGHYITMGISGTDGHSGYTSMLQNLVHGLFKQQGFLQALLKSSMQWRTAAAAAPTSSTLVQDIAEGLAGQGITAAAATGAAARGLPAGIQQCPLLNVSICLASVSGTGAAAAAAATAASDASTAAARHLHMAAGAAAAATEGRMSEGSSDSSSSSSAADTAGLLVVVYNSLAWPRQEWVRLPVAAVQDAAYTVEGKINAYETQCCVQMTACCRTVLHRHPLLAPTPTRCCVLQMPMVIAG